jgi:hypothetical protein
MYLLAKVSGDAFSVLFLVEVDRVTAGESEGKASSSSALIEEDGGMEEEEEEEELLTSRC